MQFAKLTLISLLIALTSTMAAPLSGTMTDAVRTRDGDVTRDVAVEGFEFASKRGDILVRTKRKPVVVCSKF